MNNKEPVITIVIGGLLVLVGIVSYFGAGASSVTALIPAFFGAPLILLGVLARAPQRLKLSMHLVAALALFGVLGTLTVLPALGELLLGKQKPGTTAAILARSAMLVLCGGLFGVCIASFVRARRSRGPRETA
ncbi:MAG: hypothetical protein MI924_26150 [Chloroflexales bacterium]|nr:hypothetical protein [Chloroflexales bacterium]